MRMDATRQRLCAAPLDAGRATDRLQDLTDAARLLQHRDRPYFLCRLSQLDEWLCGEDHDRGKRPTAELQLSNHGVAAISSELQIEQHGAEPMRFGEIVHRVLQRGRDLHRISLGYQQIGCHLTERGVVFHQEDVHLPRTERLPS